MSDDLLTAIDDSFALRTASPQSGRRRTRRTAGADHPPAVRRTLPEALSASGLRSLLGPVELFIAIQFLWGALMFVPGVQSYRAIIRALPYASTLLLMGRFLLRKRSDETYAPPTTLLMMALALLGLNLLHPTSQPYAGLAQCVFQASIAAPLFWAPKFVRSPQQLERLVMLIFVCNLISAFLGVLQVYWPARFLPPEFSALGLRMNQYYVDSLTYAGTDGRLIVRPPGLSDQPGGASIAGAMTVLIGLGLLMRSRKPSALAGLAAAIAVGLAVIYFTQVRSVLLVTLGSGAALCLLALRTGRAARAAGILAVGGALVFAAFFWASSLGGSAVQNRFLDLQRTGALQAYQENRGGFLTQTVGELLDQYPFGAGLGRWGMMNVYFGDPADVRSSPIYVEIQPTGWLLDGGVFMWLLYGGAVALALRSSYKLARTRAADLATLASCVFVVQLFVATMTLVAPVFNTQLGILFWALTGMLHGASVVPEDDEVTSIAG